MESSAVTSKAKLEIFKIRVNLSALAHGLQHMGYSGMPWENNAPPLYNWNKKWPATATGVEGTHQALLAQVSSQLHPFLFSMSVHFRKFNRWPKCGSKCLRPLWFIVGAATWTWGAALQGNRQCSWHCPWSGISRLPVGSSKPARPPTGLMHFSIS